MIKIANDKVTQIISLRDHTERTEYLLEPELISNLYDQKREKRRIVAFDDIPKVMVNALCRLKTSTSSSMPVSIRSASCARLGGTCGMTSGWKAHRPYAATGADVVARNGARVAAQDPRDDDHDAAGAEAHQAADLRLLREFHLSG